MDNESTALIPTETRPVRRALNTALLNLSWEAESLDQDTPAGRGLSLEERISLVRQATVLLEQFQPLNETGTALIGNSAEYVSSGFFLMTAARSAVFFHLQRGQWLSVEVPLNRMLIFRRLGEQLNDLDDEAWPGVIWRPVLDVLARGLPEVAVTVIPPERTADVAPTPASTPAPPAAPPSLSVVEPPPLSVSEQDSPELTVSSSHPEPSAAVVTAAPLPPGVSAPAAPPLLLVDGPLLPVFEGRLISVIKRAIAAAANQVRSSTLPEQQQRYDDLYQIYEHLSRPNRRWPLSESESDQGPATWARLYQTGFTLVHTSGILDFSRTKQGWMLRAWDFQRFSQVLRQNFGPNFSAVKAYLEGHGSSLHFLTHPRQIFPETPEEKLVAVPDEPVQPTRFEAQPLLEVLEGSSADEPVALPDRPVQHISPELQTLQEKVRDRPLRPGRAESSPPAGDSGRPGPALPRVSWVTALKRAIRNEQERLAEHPSAEAQLALEALQRVNRGCLELKRQVFLSGVGTFQASGKTRSASLLARERDGLTIMGQRGCLLLRQVDGQWLVDDWDSGRPASVRLRRPDARWQDPEDPEWPPAAVREVFEELELPGTAAAARIIQEAALTTPEIFPGREHWNGLLNATAIQMLALMEDAPAGPWLTEMRRILLELEVISRALNHPERELPLAPVDAVARAHWNLLVSPRLEQQFFLTTLHGVWVFQPAPDGYTVWSWDVRQPTQVSVRSLDVSLADPLRLAWPPEELAPLIGDLVPLLVPSLAPWCAPLKVDEAD